MKLDARARLWLSNCAIAALITSATAVMMLCPCDSVGVRDHYAIFLVALSVLLGIAAAVVIYHRVRRDSGITGFLRAVIAIAIVGFGVYAELFITMEVIAWLARSQ